MLPARALGPMTAWLEANAEGLVESADRALDYTTPMVVGWKEIGEGVNYLRKYRGGGALNAELVLQDFFSGLTQFQPCL